jgi:hypothetical protein
MDAKTIKEQAKQEFEEERSKEAKEKIKKKLRELAAAKKVVTNIEREIEDLEDELSQAD